VPKDSSSQPHSIFQLWLQIGVVALMLLDAPLVLTEVLFSLRVAVVLFRNVSAD